MGALVLAVGPAALAATAPAPARAADEPAEILLESVTPLIPKRGHDIEIGGRVANTGTTDIVTPAVQLRFSPLPLNSREEVRQIFNGTTERDGNALTDTLSPLPATLVPGQQAEFLLRVPVADLGLPADSAGVYALFVELLSEGTTVSTAATAFPWFPPSALYEPSELAVLWPITQEPAVAANELVTQPGLPGEFLPTGRLSQLVDVGEEHNVSWLVDTATLETAQDMADGYQVPGPDGPQPGDKTAAAGAFAQRLQALLNRKRHTTLPQYALADDDALTRSGLDSFVVRSATLPGVVRDRLAGASDAKVAVIAPEGTADGPTLEALVDAGVRRFVMSDRYFPPSSAVSYTPSGVTRLTVAGTDVTVLLTDRLLDRDLARPLTTAADRARAQQQLLVDTAMVTLELPAEPRRVAAAPPELWSPPTPWLRSVLTALDRAPWLRLVGVDRIGGGDPIPRTFVGYSGNAEARELPPDYLRRIADADEQLQRLSQIVSDPAGFGETYRLALQRGGSAIWRDQQAEREAFIATIESQLRTLTDSVRVVSSGTVTLAGDNGVVPLTIANDLDQPVTVGVQLATDTPIRLQYTPPAPVKIGANQKAGLEVPVRVVGSQSMTVRIVLTDSEGRLFDDSASLELRSTAATRIATVVVGVGAVALVFLVGLNLVRRRRNPPEREPDRTTALADRHA